MSDRWARASAALAIVITAGSTVGAIASATDWPLCRAKQSAARHPSGGLSFSRPAGTSSTGIRRVAGKIARGKAAR
jgi:hypothetical protein